MSNAEDCSWLTSLPCLIPQWKNTCSKRNIFMPYVSDIGGIGVDATAYDGDALKITMLKQKNANISFRARVPCLPFMEANLKKSSTDVCMKSMDNLKKAQDQFRNHYRVYWAVARRSKGLGKELRKQLTDLKNELRSTKKPVKELKVPKQVRHLQKLMPSSFNDPADYNDKYLKGCLTSEALNDGKAMLIYPIGETMDHLAITTLSHDANEPIQWKSNANSKFNLDKGQIHQISSSKSGYEDKVFCAVRHKHTLTYHAFVVDDGMPCLQTTYVVPEKKIFNCVQVNPYYEGEIAYTKSSGSLAIRDIESDSYISRMNLDTELMEQLWTVEYGAHPKEVVCTSPKSVYYKDLRGGKRVAALSNYSSNLNHYSFNLFSKQSPANAMHQFIISKYELLLVDRRFPSKTVHCWNHMLASTPLACDIVKLNNDETCIALLSSQTSQETCCIPLTSLQSTQPVSQPLWHTSKPSDLSEVVDSISSGYAKRLNKPIIGMCGLPFDENAFSTFTVTSIGDVFGQDFSSDFDSGDKTFGSKFGLKDLNLDTKTLHYIKTWLQTCPDEPDTSSEFQYLEFFPTRTSADIREQMMSHEDGQTDFAPVNIEEDIQQFITGRTSRSFELDLPSSIEEFDVNQSEDLFSNRIMRAYWPEKYD